MHYINHWKLFAEMVDRKIPACIINVLVYWYQQQLLCIKWNNLISETFPISNGIKQGGILSPRLFNIYVDILSRKLNAHKIGCCINNVIFNHLYYAEDLVLISPSVMGLQSVLTECELFQKSMI